MIDECTDHVILEFRPCQPEFCFDVDIKNATALNPNVIYGIGIDRTPEYIPIILYQSNGYIYFHP